MTNCKKHINLTKNSLSFWLVLLLLIAYGCGEKKSPPPKALASVDGTVLTDTYLEKIKTAYSFSDSDKKKIVNGWIEDEVFLREAEEEGALESGTFNVLVRESKSEIAKALLLKKFFDSVDENVSNDEIESYYKNHNGEFILTEDVYLLDAAQSDDFAALLSFRQNAISAGWQKAANENPKINVVSGLKIKPEEVGAGEFRNLLLSINKGRTSPVVKKSGRTFIVFKINKILRKGSTSTLEDVRDDIIERIKLQKKIISYEKYKEKLFSKHKIEIYGDLNE